MNAMPTKKYRLYGVNLATAFDFRSPLPETEGPPDLVLKVTERIHEPLEPDAVTVYESPIVDDAGECVLRLVRHGGSEFLQFGSEIGFEMQGDRVECRIAGPELAPRAEIAFLGSVMSYWLETRGVVALHASAVRTARGAVAFLGSHGTGKTTVASALVAAGQPLLSDDILAVGHAGTALVARPSLPHIKLWPEDVRRLLRRDDFAPVLPGYPKLSVPANLLGEFAPEEAPLAAIFVLDRGAQDTEVRFDELDPSHQIVELLRNTFSPYIVEAVGLQRQRLDFFARITGNFPIVRLGYPSGHDQVPRVVEAVLRRMGS